MSWQVITILGLVICLPIALCAGMLLGYEWGVKETEQRIAREALTSSTSRPICTA